MNRKSGLKLYNRRSVYISGVLLGDKILVCSLKTQDKQKTSLKVWSKLIHMQDSLIPTDKFLLFTSARLIACFVLTCHNTTINSNYLQFKKPKLAYLEMTKLTWKLTQNKTSLLGSRRWNWKFREKHFLNLNPELLLHSSYSFWP